MSCIQCTSRELQCTTPWVKKTRHQTLGHNFTDYYPIFNFFTIRLGSKFATNSCLNIPPCFKHVTLWNMNAEKWHRSKIRIAINDESQGSIAKNFRCDESLYYTFIIHSAGERIFKIGEHLAKLGQNRWLCHILHSPCTFVLKHADLTR